MSEPTGALDDPTPYAHRRRVMSGRDPDEQDRSATPLELLYDLVFVVAFGVAAGELAHSLAAGHPAAGLTAFALCMFAVIWAWVNFTWFASAFDTNDWLYRVVSMVQMLGVALLALGISDVFASIEEGDRLDSDILVIGYVVMRSGLIAQWVRAYRGTADHRTGIRTNITVLLLAQVGWVAAILIAPPLPVALALAAVLFTVELVGPLAVSRRGGVPWHAHHLAERYGLLAIIALGEGIVGTIGAISVLIDSAGWSPDATLLLVCGVGVTFGMWWIYFVLPSGEVLRVHRGRAKVWAYSHIVLFTAIAAVGAGLHVFAYYLDAEDAGFTVEISGLGAALSVALPLAVYNIGLFGLYAYLVRSVGPLYVQLVLGTAAVLVAGVLLAAAGAPPTWALGVLCLAPVVLIVGYETREHVHKTSAMRRIHLRR
jgi:low temperature requirement protein LtrA